MSIRRLRWGSLVLAIIYLCSGGIAYAAYTQRQLYQMGLNYYDVQASSCSISGNQTIGSPIAGTLSSEKVPETMRSKIIKASSDAGVPAGAIAGLYLTEQNGFPFYESYYKSGKTDTSAFTSITKDDAVWHIDKYNTDNWTKNEGGRGFSGPFQFGASEWQTYGNGGDVNKFDDAVGAAARYFKVLMDQAKKNLNTDDQSKLISEAARMYNGQTGIGIDGRQIQYIYGDQVALLASALSTGGNAAVSGNTDYAGNPIFNQAQLDTISKNQPIYEQAADEVGIPWQMLAVIHVRESGLSRSNPANGQGIYQFVSKQGGPYPPGPVDDAEFLRQTKLAADFIKNKAAGTNYPQNQSLSTSSGIEAIKDTFFSYNGRAQAYIDQAVKLGFDGSTQGYEGSPYVMNKADAQRDPSVNKTTWGQIKTDHGGLEYPANNDYGAFVQYAALSGVAIGAGGGNSNCVASGNSTVSCTGPANTTAGLSPVRQQAVCIAQQELALWDSGQMQPGTGPNGYHKYSQGRSENWCADFVSWVYNQAGHPLSNNNDGNVPAVDTVRQIGESGTNGFSYHPAGSYTPRPGDLIIHQENGNSHVNMVVAVSGNTMKIIGGNQKTWDFNTSSVSTYTDGNFTGDNISGYVSPD